jgi:cell shape-determining protein MreC
MERMSVFVKVDEYDDVLEIVQAARKKIDEAKDTLSKIHDLKNEEDHQLEMWQSTLGEIEKKVDFIDHSLSEPEHY